MINMTDPQVQRIVAALSRQREDALDTVALALATIAAHEATIADLNKKLAAATAPAAPATPATT